ncbi:MAG: RidA family protein, partial [Emcibacteraceae bacterium]|nr:RidA family protein [Emcibacteraceae bacterium]
MKIERFDKGPRMSRIVVHGETIYLSGIVGSGEGITEQTTSMLAMVDKRLAEVGSNKSKILSAIVWVATMDDFSEMNVVWDAWIDPENPPTRACGEAR